MTRPPAPQTVVVTSDPATPPHQPPESVPYSAAQEHVPGPKPIATLTLIAVLLLVTLAFWMMVLGVQQGRA